MTDCAAVELIDTMNRVNAEAKKRNVPAWLASLRYDDEKKSYVFEAKTASGAVSEWTLERYGGEDTGLDLLHDVLLSSLERCGGIHGDAPANESVDDLIRQHMLTVGRIRAMEIDTGRTDGNDEAVSHDPVNHPGHYCRGGIECIDAIRGSMSAEAYRGFLKGNVMKYVFRYEAKNGLEDLRKARWYLERLIGEFRAGDVSE